MKHELMKLPFGMDELEPHMSKETLEYHYGKHHQTYVNKLNDMIAQTEYENMSLEAIIEKAEGPIFNNAAQVFNHDFFWHSLNPTTTTPSSELFEQIQKDFGSMERFKEAFLDKAVGLFGSGWVWLTLQDGKLQIVTTSNAQTPLTEGIYPLLTCDVWEHAYYIDYRNARPLYLDSYWKLVNWDFVSKNFSQVK
jgi:Fe-Mn family superoxide dismutase